MAPRPLLVALLLTASCSLSASGPRYDSGLEGLDVTQVGPELILPGSSLVVLGRSFVDLPFGDSTLVLRGRFDDGKGYREVTIRSPLRFVDFERMEATVGEDFVAQLGSRTGRFYGSVAVEVDSKVDGEVHASREISLDLDLRTSLTPRLDVIRSSDVIYVNDRIGVEGDGLLLGGGEGTTYAIVEGCFGAGGDDCEPIEPVRVAVEPDGMFERRRGGFVFLPSIAGIRAGRFEGLVRLENDHGAGPTTRSDSFAVDYELVEAAIDKVGPDDVSLGQYVEVTGGGFIGAADREVTLLHLSGTFTPINGAAVALDTLLVPEFVDGHTVRYAINEDDHLGQAIDPRGAGGTFTGSISPRVSYRNEDVSGEPRDVTLRVAPVRQIVYLRFTPQYVTSLQELGLRAVDLEVRARVLDVVERDYAGVNFEVRTGKPTDFAVYAEVEIGGPDPNGMGLLGYDNTPGKDVGNLRLYDRIGGVNALTQQDDYPGFGGVFVESLFVFSEHPEGHVDESSSAADADFDDTFDEFRPDRGGEPVRADDLAGAPDLTLSDASSCPATDRRGQIRCGIWVLGSLIGTTVSHELGHSLGLANPDGADPHLAGDKPGRLMEAGGARPFDERAELHGTAPGMFCDEEYAYLLKILPTDRPDDQPRPDCGR